MLDIHIIDLFLYKNVMRPKSHHCAVKIIHISPPMSFYINKPNNTIYQAVSLLEQSFLQLRQQHKSSNYWKCLKFLTRKSTFATCSFTDDSTLSNDIEQLGDKQQMKHKISRKAIGHILTFKFKIECICSAKNNLYYMLGLDHYNTHHHLLALARFLTLSFS